MRISYDKAARLIQISATISEAIADTLRHALETFSVAPTDIAGARFVPRSDAQILQQYRIAA